ncbi:hypothetical protein [Mycolicibacterium frederiksbergense]
MTVLHQDIGDTSAPKARGLSDGGSLQNRAPAPDHAGGEHGWTGSGHHRD